MNGIALIPGTECVANGRIYQIDRVESASTVAARDKATGECVNLRISQLHPLPGKLKHARREISQISEADWNRAAALADAFSRLDAHKASLVSLKRIAAATGLSVRHVQRLRRAYLRSPGVSTLAPVRGGRAVRANRIDQEIVDVINHVIQKRYLVRERPPMSEIVMRAQSLCRRLGLAEPSRKAVELRIKRIPQEQRDRARLGAKAAKQRHQPRPGSLGQLGPLEVIQIDHTRVDVMVLSDDRSQVLGRPWITLAIDVGTRCVMGMYLSMDAPSSDAVSLCIDHLVLPKPENEEPGFTGIWPMYGKPKSIHVDNGSDFRSDALSRGCQQHGITLEWRPIKTPHYGGHIERLNGTLMKDCHLLAGTTFSNPKEKGDYNSTAQARYTLSELRAWLVQRICRIYHARRHKALGVPPMIAWERAWMDEKKQIVLPPLLSDPLDFRMDFLPCEYRKVSRTGIQLFNSRYWCEELRPLVGSTDLQPVRYDRGSLGTVFVRAKEGHVIEVPAVAGPAAGEARQVPLDDLAEARMKQFIDQGLAANDEIEAQAYKAARRVKRLHGKKMPSQTALAAVATEQLTIKFDVTGLPPLSVERLH